MEKNKGLGEAQALPLRTSMRQRIVQRGRDLVADNRFLQAALAKKWALLLVAMAFLLGRAMILEQLAPFAVAFFAVVYFLRRDVHRWVGLFLILGSLFAVELHTGFIAAEILIFMAVQKALESYERSDISFAPLMVFMSAFIVELFAAIIQKELSWYGLMMIGINAVLSFVLTLIFIQAVKVFTLSRRNYNLKNEEIICLMILLASVMTGAVGWLIGPVSIEHVLTRFLILLFAFVGGAPLGASVGVITGLILSLASMNAVYQMSLLAFAGLLAGLLREGGKMAVAFGMLLGSSILAIYIGNQTDVLHSTWESVAAVVLFLLTPRSVMKTVAKYVPGTQEYTKSQHDYAKRVRDVTASRVEQFSEVFRQLAKSFVHLSPAAEAQQAEETATHFMNAVSTGVCRHCTWHDKCWGPRFMQTHKLMTDMMTLIEERPQVTRREFPKTWDRMCLKTGPVMDVMKQQYEMYKHDLHWKRQIQDSRQLVAEQLNGVSQVMEDLAKEIKREGQELFLQEEQIRGTLEKLGLSIHGIDIISLDEGNVEIEIVHQYTKGFDECRKIIAPLLSDILGENIAVRSERPLQQGEGYAVVVFGSAKEYEIETGVAGAAKGGDLLSGDSYSAIELGNGKFAVAISDGMGNGERAREESSAALSILQRLLQSGMDERLAIKSVNSVLLLRSPDEMFATVDVALIDMYTANTTFLKIGSTPSFIKRGSEVIPISANNLPIGILQDIEVDLISLQLQPGDTLIMMTDGIYDAPGYTVNKEMWMKRVISEVRASEPQEIADCLLETVVRHHHGEIRDDMTVVVARIEKHKPEWAAFRWHGADRVERPRTVS